MTVYTKWGAQVQFPVVHLLLAVTLLVGSAFPVRAEAIVNQQFAARRSIGSSYEFPGTSASDRIIIFIVGEFNRSNQTGGSPQVSTVYAFYGLLDPITFRFRVTAEGFAEFPANSGAQITPSLERATIKASFLIKFVMYDDAGNPFGEKLIPVVINATWTGVFDRNQNAFQIRTHDIGPNYVLNSSIRGNFRSATSSGTITFDETTYDLSQAIPGITSAFLGEGTQSSISIVHR